MNRRTQIGFLRLIVSMLVSVGGVAFAQSSSSTLGIMYTLSMPKPQTHYFEVKIQVNGTDVGAFKNQGYVDFKMPVWTPGSYLVREYAKNVEGVKATGVAGSNLNIQKINKNTWRVFHQNSSSVTLSYKVYAYELTVRTSFLDESHGYLNGASVFMFVNQYKESPSVLSIEPFADWKVVSTGLTPIAGQKFTYSVPNYDILVDSPIEIGNHKVLKFDLNGIPHFVAMYGEASYDEAKLLKDMKRVTEEASKVVGEHPCKDYTFIVHNINNGGGGLEHLNSTSLQVSRTAYKNEARYTGFLSLVAHEYFHLWNVKRIRPKALGPFDYENENYTHLLWVAEGFTTFYQNYILRRAGFYTPEQYLNVFANGIATIENTPGQRVQSLAESSWDAWIKYYRPNENSKNSVISYYDKGAIVGGLLNLAIIESTKGQKNLDDVMRYLWDEYYKKQKRGFTDEEMQSAIEKIAGKSMNDFFQKYIWGTEPIDYSTFFSPVGCQVIEYPQSKDAYLGAEVKVAEGVLSISTIYRDSPAYEQGLNVNDELVALDGTKIPQNIEAFNRLLASKTSNEQVTFTVVRDGLVKNISIKLGLNPNKIFKIQRISNPSADQEMLFKKWMFIDSK